MAGSDNTHGVHRLGNSQEAVDIGAQHVVALGTELGGGFVAVLVDIDHDLLKALLGVIEGPGVAAGVLLHFQGGRGNTAGVGGLARAIGNLGILEHDNAFRRGRHIGAFGHGNTAVFDQHLGVFTVQLVLGCAGQRHIARHAPDVTVFHVLGIFVVFSVGADPATLHFFDALQGLQVDALLMDNHALGIGAGNDLGAQLVGFLDRVNGHVAGTGNHHGFAVQ